MLLYWYTILKKTAILNRLYIGMTLYLFCRSFKQRSYILNQIILLPAFEDRCLIILVQISMTNEYLLYKSYPSIQLIIYTLHVIFPLTCLPIINNHLICVLHSFEKDHNKVNYSFDIWQTDKHFKISNGFATKNTYEIYFPMKTI